MLVKIPCESDRYLAHQTVEWSIRQSKDDPNPRDYLWRLCDGYAIAQVGVVEHGYDRGHEVEFSIETVPVISTSGVKRPIPQSAWRDWLSGQLLKHAGLAVVECEFEPVHFEIAKPGTPTFGKPAALFKGKALVHSPNQLTYGRNFGVGSAKAFGFGLLIVE
jgi:hypothetical protein